MVYGDFKTALPFDPLLVKLVIDKKIDVIHLHTPITLGMQAVIITKLLQLPLVGTFHTFFADPGYLKHFSLNNRFVEKLAWRYSNLFYNRCDLVVCPSQGTKAHLIANGCKRPVQVMHHGVDLSTFDNRNAAKLRKQFTKRGKLLLFVGRIAHEKNIPYLLDCMPLIVKKLPSTKLVIVGSGPQISEVKEKISALGLDTRVILTGEIPHELLVNSGVYGACDLFVTASTTETGPMTMLEAQANGMVCVGVEGRGMNIIKNGINGYLVKPDDTQAFADAIVRLLTHSELMGHMQKETLARIQRYDLNRIILRWEKIYTDLVALKHH